MKNIFMSLAIVLCGCMSAFSQVTSLTVDCQNPGWLSSIISYEDQLTLRNIKLTGYINQYLVNYTFNRLKTNELH